MKKIIWRGMGVYKSLRAITPQERVLATRDIKVSTYYVILIRLHMIPIIIVKG